MTQVSKRHLFKEQLQNIYIPSPQSERFIQRKDKEMTTDVSTKAAMLLRAFMCSLSWP